MEFSLVPINKPEISPENTEVLFVTVLLFLVIISFSFLPTTSIAITMQHFGIDHSQNPILQTKQKTRNSKQQRTQINEALQFIISSFDNGFDPREMDPSQYTALNDFVKQTEAAHIKAQCVRRKANLYRRMKDFEETQGEQLRKNCTSYLHCLNKITHLSEQISTQVIESRKLYDELIEFPTTHTQQTPLDSSLEQHRHSIIPKIRSVFLASDTTQAVSRLHVRCVRCNNYCPMRDMNDCHYSASRLSTQPHLICSTCLIDLMHMSTPDQLKCASPSCNRPATFHRDLYPRRDPRHIVHKGETRPLPSHLINRLMVGEDEIIFSDEEDSFGGSQERVLVNSPQQ
jgi:hypothetical protein